MLASSSSASTRCLRCDTPLGNEIGDPGQTPREVINELVRRNQRGIFPDPVVEAILSEPCVNPVTSYCQADKAERISAYYAPELTALFGSD